MRTLIAIGAVVIFLAALAVLLTSRAADKRPFSPLSLMVYDAASIVELSSAPVGTLALFLGTPDAVPEEWQQCKGQTIAVEPGNVLYGDFGLPNGGELSTPTWNSIAIMASSSAAYRYGVTYTIRLMGPSEQASEWWQPLLTIVRVQ